MFLSAPISALPLLLPTVLTPETAGHAATEAVGSFVNGAAASLPSTETAFRMPGIFASMAANFGPGPLSSVSSHADLLLIGAAFLAAGAGAAAYLFRRNRNRKDELPNDGVNRTELQRKLLSDALQLERNMSSTDGKLRREALLSMMDLLRRLAPPDRKERIRRIAQQLCLDWSAINKDSKIGDQIKNRIPRLQKPLLDALVEELKAKQRERQIVNISANAAAILKWIDGK